MRPNQNKRMRGRNGGNRKGPNPLSRTYESNGPDVKIRGTAHHIGEKYLQLARDAQSSGDPVMAESFLQHAEHYFRLIAAAQAAQQQAAGGYQRPAGEPEAEDLDEEEEFVGGMDRFASPIERANNNAQPNYQQSAPQPTYPDRERNYGNGGERPYYERGEQRQDRGQRQDHRGERGERGDRHERHERQDRSYSERQQQQGGRDRDDQRGGRRQNRDFRGEGGGRYERGEPRGNTEEVEGAKGLPAFITAPVRLQAESHIPDEQPNEPDVLDASDAEGDFQMRQRRRRRRPDLGEGPAEVTSATDPVSD
jgi:hypothetical protein